jgi:glycosyltransferase involved in cell wall biosynthesis
MKIGINSPNIASGYLTGVEQYIISLIESLVKIDEKNRYTIYTDRNFSFPRLGSQIFYIKTNSTLKRFIWDCLSSANRAHKDGLQLLHCTKSVLPLFLSCPGIITIYDLIFFHTPKYYSLHWRAYWKTVIELSAKRAVALVTISNSTAEDIVKFLHIPIEKIYVVYPGVDHDLFKYPLGSVYRENVLKKLGLVGSFILTGCVALQSRKNIEGVLEAYYLCHKQNREMPKLVVVGPEGLGTDKIYKTCRKLGIGKYVTFTGYVDRNDLPFIYSAAEVFIYASFYEGFGLPILEAMACGCPVIASNIKPLIETAGGAALLVDPYNVQSISEGINRLLNDKCLRGDLIEKGLKRAEQFSWDKAARQTIEIYEKIAQSNFL